MDAVKIDTILDKFSDLLSWHSGNSSASADIPCSSASPVSGGLCFCQDQPHLQNCFSSGVSILVVPPSLADEAQALNSGSTAVLVSHELQTAMAKLNSAFFLPSWGRESFGQEKIHPSANVHPRAKLHDSVIVQPGAMIGPDVSIDEGTVIGANTTL